METMTARRAAEPATLSMQWAGAPRQALIARDQALAALMQRVQSGSEGAYAQLLQDCRRSSAG